MEAFEFAITKVVGEQDIDEFKHVNNLRYIAWAMECAVEHGASLGVYGELYQSVDAAFVVKTHRFTYMRPAKLDDEVEVRTRISHNDKKLKLTRDFSIVDTRTGNELVVGETEFVCVRLSTGKPIRMPKEFLSISTEE